MRHQTQETRAERGRRLLNEIDGAAGEAVIAGLQDIAPAFAELLFEFPFGDIYAREALSLRDREIATVAALSAMGTAPKQLGVHVHGALNVGVTGEEVVEGEATAMVFQCWNGWVWRSNARVHDSKGCESMGTGDCVW